MRALSPRTLRELDATLESVEDGRHVRPEVLRRLRVDIAACLKPKRAAAPARKRRESKRATHREETAGIREAVMARAGERCECCGGYTSAPEMDHFFGGNGRRRALQSVETCWGICWTCHVAKTKNSYGPTWALERFIRHCARQEKRALSPEQLGGWVQAKALAAARLSSLEAQRRAGGVH